MPVLFHSNLAERFANILLEFFVIFDPLHDQIFRITAYPGLKCPHSRVSFIRLPDNCLAHLRIFHLRQLLLDRTRGQCSPSRAHVVEVPVLQGKGESAAYRCSLAENWKTLAAAAFDPP